jgi:hypothetical protein
MDEATSALDVALEQTVNANVGALGTTRIIVAHRPKTIASASHEEARARPEFPPHAMLPPASCECPPIFRCTGQHRVRSALGLAVVKLRLWKKQKKPISSRGLLSSVHESTSCPGYTGATSRSLCNPVRCGNCQSLALMQAMQRGVKPSRLERIASKNSWSDGQYSPHVMQRF